MEVAEAEENHDVEMEEVIESEEDAEKEGAKVAQLRAEVAKLKQKLERRPYDRKKEAYSRGYPNLGLTPPWKTAFCFINAAVMLLFYLLNIAEI